MSNEAGDRARSVWQPKRVVVVGAGIAGLTAAHELVERGFEVEVVEPEWEGALPWFTHATVPAEDASAEALKKWIEKDFKIDEGRLKPVVGGMARSRWVSAPVPWERNPGREYHAPDEEPFVRATTNRIPPPATIVFPEKTFDREVALKALGPWIKALMVATNDGTPLDIQVQVVHVDKSDPPECGASVVELLNKISLAIGRSQWRASCENIPVGVGDACLVGHVYVNALHDQLAAEHGFRFFPAFYRHLFDTMQRLPIMQDVGGQSPLRALPGMVADSARSTYDNLVSAESFEFALPRDVDRRSRSYRVPRSRPRSIEEIRKLLGHVFRDAGYTGKDLARLQLKYLQFLLSHPDRRRDELEKLSWSTFLGVDRFSSRFREHVLGAAQALTAMSSRRNDARTIGTIAMQLTLDQTRGEGHVDSTLNGPTSTSLLFHWRRHLEAQGVVFTLGALVGFEGVGMATRPVFATVLRPDGTPYATTADPSDRGVPATIEREQLRVEPADYYVITMPVDAFQALWKPVVPPPATKTAASATKRDAGEIPPEVAQREPRYSIKGGHPTLCTTDDLMAANREHLAPGCDRHDLGWYLAYEIDNRDRFEDPTTGSSLPGHENDDIGVDLGPLRHMVGIQFYVDTDVRVFKGHTMCQDSPWGVSYLCQAQYWQHRRRPYDGYRGVISAIFTRFNVLDRDPGTPKCAWRCTPDEIARRVWAQIEECWDERANGPLPTPKFYYLDEGLEFNPGGGVKTNETPYLVNIVDHWARRPGRRKASEHEYEYDLQLGHTVFAGVFMRTHTRLTTMESANESARRAVNAILRCEGLEHALCRTWNPEDHEADDLLPLRELDQAAHARRLRHSLDSSVAELALEVLPWDLLRLGAR